MLKIGWFSSGEVNSSEGRRAARELLDTVMNAKKDGILDIEISFVFSNIEPGERPFGNQFFKLVTDYGLPLVAFSSETFEPEMKKRSREEWRNLYDNACLSSDYLGSYEKPDLCVLAGDMTIWGSVKCAYFNAINLHPALPTGSAGTWQNVIWEVIKQNSNEHGVMMHKVTPELDKGPVITYCRFPIKGGCFEALWNIKKIKLSSPEEIKEYERQNKPLSEKIREEGVKRELPLLIYTLKQFADQVIRFEGNKVFEGNSELIGGLDLTDKVESYVHKYN